MYHSRSGVLSGWVLATVVPVRCCATSTVCSMCAILCVYILPLFLVVLYLSINLSFCMGPIHSIGPIHSMGPILSMGPTHSRDPTHYMGPTHSVGPIHSRGPIHSISPVHYVCVLCLYMYRMYVWDLCQG